MKNTIIKTAVALAIVLFASCAKTDFEPIPQSQLMGDSLTTTFTIQQLLDTFMTNNDVYTDTVGKKAGLFTADTIKSKTNREVVISGVVTSTDVEGNVYKFMTVQELFPGGKAIKISVDASGLSGLYPLGQRVWIRCNGLCLGKYAQSPQIGVRFVNLDKVKINTAKTNTVYRLEPGRIPPPIAMKAIHAYGMPDTTLVKVDTMTIAQIKTAGPGIINRLVCIKNAFFTGRGADFNKPALIQNDIDYIFAPSTNGVGYPQSREIQDPTGSIFVSTSEFAKFAKNVLPPSANIGNITAIVGWYNDKKADVNPSSITAEIYHQLTIRTMSDLGKGFESYHTSLKSN
ncbi:MAG: DUF5689 domain-containing protein [Paludibacter sp.]